MIVKYAPQVNNNCKLEYEFEVDKIKVKLLKKDEEVTIDEFDFTQMPDGVASEIISKISPCPIFEARRKDGELIVEVLKWIDEDATHEECFPEDEVIE